MTAVQTKGTFACFRDSWFWLAVIAAPLVWLAMHVLFKLPLNRSLTHSAITLLLLIVVYPVLEEIVFRGALQGFLREKAVFLRSLAGVTLANLLTSVVFTGLHFFNHPPLWAALVFGPSLVFGWVRDRYDHLLPSILLHAFYNAGFVLLFT